MSLPLKETLNALVGRSYLRNGKALTVEKVTVGTERVVIYTTEGSHEKHPDQVPAFIKTLVPMEGSAPVAAATNLPVKATIAAPSKLEKMQTALMAALDKVQEDESYIEQARTISKLVQTGINLARLELDAIKQTRA